MGRLSGRPEGLADLLPGEPFRFAGLGDLGPGEPVGGGSDAVGGDSQAEVPGRRSRDAASGRPPTPSLRGNELVDRLAGRGISCAVGR